MRWKRLHGVVLSAAMLLVAQHPTWAQGQPAGKLPAAKPEILPPPRPLELDPRVVPFRPIDLPTALRLAGVYNPEIKLARERVLEAVALRQLAAAQLLPNINAG